MESLKQRLYANCQDWMEVLEPLDDLFSQCLERVVKCQIIHPSKEDIMNAFAFTKLNSVRVVIIGQDPYTTPGVANGLAFATNYEKHLIPPSLRNVYKALISQGLIGTKNAVSSTDIHDRSLIPTEYSVYDMPDHGDISPWAFRGVLLLNTQLTSGTAPGDHKFWEEYVNAIITRLSEVNPKLVWFLWGQKAQAKEALLKNYAKVLKCVHPSPTAGTSFPAKAGPLFAQISREYGVDWEPYFYDLYFVATDGACKGNGRKDAVGGIGVYFPDSFFGKPNGITGKFSAKLPATCTNNVAELTAGIDALSRIMLQPVQPMHKRKIVLVTDSEYFYNTVTKGWIWKDDSAYKNPELRKELRKLLVAIMREGKLIMKHILAHKRPDEIEKMDEPDRTFSLMNMVADELADGAARE